jgi:hypothetical protein
MKIGDKVRFLSEKGGGRVAGFQGKDIVLVEDEDGFEIPFPVKEVVVVEDDDYSTRRIVKNKQGTEQRDNRSVKERLSDNEADDDEEEDDDPADGFTAPVTERRGGDLLSVFLAFVPVDVKAVSTTTFETFLVNDSNYFVHYTYMVAEGASWTLRSAGVVEPNTKVFIEEFGREKLNEMAHTCVQLTAYKRNKPFMLKPAIDVRFRVDAVKFYKLNTFRENDFFETPALLYPVVENDVPLRMLAVDAKQLKREMYGKNGESEETGNGKAPARREGLVHRYDKSQSKSRPVSQRLKDDKIVIDLHANALLETTAGMSASDILDYQLDVFRRTLEQYKDKKGQKLVFIHGKGEGVLRQSIIHELNYKYKQYPYQDASFQEYGYGATQVTVR